MTRAGELASPKAGRGRRLSGLTSSQQTAPGEKRAVSRRRAVCQVPAVRSFTRATKPHLQLPLELPPGCAYDDPPPLSERQLSSAEATRKVNPGGMGVPLHRWALMAAWVCHPPGRRPCLWSQYCQVKAAPVASAWPFPSYQPSAHRPGALPAMYVCSSQAFQNRGETTGEFGGPPVRRA